jgi:anti-anti-sigma factor
MITPLTVSTDRDDDGKTVLVASGEIDLSNIETFTQALAAAVGDGRFVVDLRAVDYLDSVGINALFTYADHIRLIAGPTLMSVLTVSGITELVSIERVDNPTTR